MSTLLIDFTNVFMIHWSSNAATNLSGEPIGAVKGSINFLSKFCQAYQPTKCIAFFDGKNGSVKRRSVYKDYKSGRKPRTVIARHIAFESIDAAARNQDYQFKALLDILETLPINVIRCDSFESDDGIAHFVNHKEQYGCDPNEDIIIVSCDKDFLQLLGPNVNIYNPISKKIITQENIVESYEVSAHNWLLYRSITGDKSDNLRGVRGIGVATLKKVLDVASTEKFTIDSIKNLSDDNKIAKKLKENIELIELNEKLMSLHEPLVSLSATERLDYQFKAFEPRLNKKEFIIKSALLSGVDVSITTNFNSLLTRKINGRESEV